MRPLLSGVFPGFIKQTALGAVPISAAINASDVGAGTFPSGAFTFQGAVMVPVAGLTSTDGTIKLSPASSTGFRSIAQTSGQAAFQVQNTNATGFSGIEYVDNSGTTQVFTGYNNGTPGEFRFNNIASSNALITFMIGGSAKLNVTSSGITLPYITIAGYIKNDASGNLSSVTSIAASDVVAGTFPSGTYVFSGTVRLPQFTSSGFVKTDAAGNLTVSATAGVVSASDVSAVALNAYFGTGKDGALTISGSTVVTLTNIMNYTNVSWASGATGYINTNGYPIRISGVLDLTNAPVGAIRCNGNTGTAGGSTGGTVGGGASSITVAIVCGAGVTGGNGGTGSSNQAGTAAPAVTAVSLGNGGPSGSGGSGGSSASFGASAARAGTAVSASFLSCKLDDNWARGILLISAGASAPGGGAGAGTTSLAGSGGGGGGSGGGLVDIFAYNLTTGASTPTSCIQVLGGNGGSGTTSTNANAGGSGGGGGGGGGFIRLVIATRTGTTVTGLLDATGGSGGTAGGANGTGTAGTAGTAGGGGWICFVDLDNNSSSITTTNPTASSGTISATAQRQNV